jgi:uncharacterized repeat protein (TIGR01451 family)
VTNNSVAAEGPLDATVTTDPTLTGCQPAPVDQVQPGFAATTTCTITPTADVSLTATATATSRTFPHDSATATSTKLGVGVINPALAIAVVADPATVAPNGQVDFTVAVHNTGDVALTMTVTDDTAPACDFTVTGTGLAPKTAQSQKCTVTALSGMDSVTDTAHFTATPVGNTATGIPITGPAATDPLTGQASGTATISTSSTTGNGSGGSGSGSAGSGSGSGSSGSAGSGGSGSGGTSGSGGSSSSSSGGSASGGGSTPSRLPFTGVDVGVPLAVGFGLLAFGVILTVRHRRTNPQPSRRRR